MGSSGRRRDASVRRFALALSLLGVAVLALAPGADARPAHAEPPPAPGTTLVELCTEHPELGTKTCKSFDSGSVLFAHLCSQLPLPPEACANVTDGRVIDRALIDEFETSWVARALRLQAQLDDGEPLRNVLLPHTHNSSNSTAYAPRLANIDPNQRYGIVDQLRMGIRGIELDLHWVPHPTGTVANGGKAVVLCHATSETIGLLTIHLGCTVDRVFADGLAEIREFLESPGNEDEVVLLYLENQLEDDPAAHAEAARILEAELGDLVARPPADQPCAPMPLDRSRADLRAAGHRVLIVGNCGPGDWGAWVHERSDTWDERGNGAGYPDFPDCTADRDERGYDDNWIRIYEDSTWLSAMVGEVTPGITPDQARAMVQCGVDMIGFDRLEPFDGRLEALVWSWAPDEPVDDPAKRCVGWGTDARFRAEECEEVRGFACRTPAGEWAVPPDRGPWRNGFAACENIGATFAVPPTGWQNERLRSAAADAGGPELWLDYQSIADDGVFVPGADSPPADPEGDTGRLPSTGGDSAEMAVAGALLLATVLAGRAAATRGRR